MRSRASTAANRGPSLSRPRCIQVVVRCLLSTKVGRAIWIIGILGGVVLLLSKERMDFVTELCQRMVQCPSLSGQEEALAGLVRQTMEKLAMTRLRLTDTECDRRDTFWQVGKTILLEGHMDHVDPRDLSQWTLTHTEEGKDGRLYGRGASDMKGSLAAMIAAAAYIKADRQSHLSGTIMVAATVHEECFEGGQPGDRGKVQPRLCCNR